MLTCHTFRPQNDDGWRLDVKRYVDRGTVDKAKLPVLMVPGYGMNTFILNYHPTGTSMVEYLCGRGYEVWTANLRGQGGSKSANGSLKYGFRELSLVDFPVVKDVVLEESETDAAEIHAVGCSLGASVMYAYLAHNKVDHGLRSMIAIGGPLRWDDVHPLVKIAFRSPTFASMVPIRGTRAMARTFLPWVKKLPWLLSIYMNVNQIDLSNTDELVKTVDDPNPYLNHQIAKWINNLDLVVGGINVTHAMATLEELPILCLLANADGIVPERAATSVCRIATKCDTEILEVGDDDGWYAHADLFISRQAERRVFAPMADWLDAVSGDSG